MADPTTTAATNSTATIGGGIADLIAYFNNSANKDATKAANVADPLNPYRAGAGAELMNLLNNPGSFKTDPGYQFAVDQGNEQIKAATNAQAGSSDPTRVGSLAPAIAKFTEGYASQAFDTRIQELFNIASGSPAEAGKIVAGGYNTTDKNLAGGITGLASILSSLGIPQAAIAAITKALGGGSGTTPGDGGAVPDPNADTGINAVPPDPNSPYAGSNDPFLNSGTPDLTGGGDFYPIDFSAPL